MRVKTFRGGSAKSVLEQVKAELGSEAVILDTQTRRENGRCVCEVTAALEAEGHGEAETDLGLDGARPGGGQWHREWDQIKSHLYALARTKADLTALTPRQRQPLEFHEVAVYRNFRHVLLDFHPDERDVVKREREPFIRPYNAHIVPHQPADDIPIVGDENHFVIDAR